LAKTVSLIALVGVPLIAAGADLTAVVCEALKASNTAFEDGDILVLAQRKIPGL
jgi:F420-0:gamma-glutamyl ligase